MLNRNIICIDLKSFFASCECVDRGLDPFKVDLVVANPYQGNGAITLAITPHLKNQGVKSRTRLYEIPKNIHYEIVPPRMKLYLEKSEAVVNILLDYVSENDLHVYSVDESFLDVTNYLKMYKKTDYELAIEIMQKIKDKLGLTSTCGIGPNMLLAKVAMDIEAKHTKDNIAKWTYDDIASKLWPITPLSKMWGIGNRMEKKLNKLGIYTIKDLANYDKNKLKDLYGIMGEELYQHANGIDMSIISDYKVPSKTESYSNSQVLFKDYDESNIKIIIKEMCEIVCRRLRTNHKKARNIGLGIGYSKIYGGGFYHNVRVHPTDLESEFLNYAMNMFDNYYDYKPIRKVTISAGNLTNNNSIQLNLFEDINAIENEEKIQSAIDEIKNKFGKNSLVKASALLNDSTIMDRNKKIGGHHE
ncbi:MAG: Y-family DNA polymerase [Bacilli bacterium]|nr:Y-family DNA polymerase [Bacilli bacterium]